MAGQEIEDFLDEEWLNEHIDFPPEVVAAIEQVFSMCNFTTSWVTIVSV